MQSRRIKSKSAGKYRQSCRLLEVYILLYHEGFKYCFEFYSFVLFSLVAYHVENKENHFHEIRSYPISFSLSIYFL